jgi:hypothetical protein
MLSLFGGALVAIAVFVTNSGFNFDTGELSSSVALIQLIAGLGIILCVLVRQRAWTIYFTVAAATIAGIAVVDLVTSAESSAILGYVVLIIGAVLARVWRGRIKPKPPRRCVP